MNKEITKAMNRKEKKINKVSKWWNKNGYKVMRVIFFPIWICMIIKEKINKKLNHLNSWSEERANEILNYYIPRYSSWCEEEQLFSFFDNGYGWSINLAKRHLKFKDRRFWKVNHYKIRTYLIDKFELEGFTKELGDCSEGWTTLVFKLK